MSKKYENTGLEHMIKSGAKGKSKNVDQMIHKVGIQYLEGKPISEIKNSYVQGLNPDDFFIHAKAAREGVISTGVNVSATGYANRKGARNLADVIKKR